MSRLSVEQVELKYPGQGERVPYFSIKNDRESKQVRILYNTINDIFFDAVHDVSVNNKFQTISCLNSDGANYQACPLCAKGYNQNIKLFIPVLDLSDNKVKYWTRSKGFVAQLQALASRNNPISGVVVEITRAGAPRDPKTQYFMQPITVNDGRTVESLGLQIPDYTGLMRVMDFAQMSNYANALDGNNTNAAMPVYQPQAPAYAPPVQPQHANAPQYDAPTTGFTPVQPTYTTAAPVSQPQYSAPIGNEPVRRTPQSSVPSYSNTAPTTPMQGIPTPLAPAPSAAPQQAAAPAFSQPQATLNAIIDSDDTIPF